MKKGIENQQKKERMQKERASEELREILRKNRFEYPFIIEKEGQEILVEYYMREIMEKGKVNTGYTSENEKPNIEIEDEEELDFGDGSEPLQNDNMFVTYPIIEAYKEDARELCKYLLKQEGLDINVKEHQIRYEKIEIERMKITKEKKEEIEEELQSINEYINSFEKEAKIEMYTALMIVTDCVQEEEVKELLEQKDIKVNEISYGNYQQEEEDEERTALDILFSKRGKVQKVEQILIDRTAQDILFSKKGGKVKKVEQMLIEKKAKKWEDLE